MKTRLFFLVLLTAFLLPAVSYAGKGKDPVRKYRTAKKKHTLSKLSVEERIQLLNLTLKDSTLSDRLSAVERDEMIKDLIVTTPEEKIPELFKRFGTDLPEFKKKFRFLHFEQMSSILNYTEPVFHKRIIDSRIFKIPYELFHQQMELNISNAGDNLFQSHYTDFCGKVAVVRIWIKYNPEDYRNFMTDLYYRGETEWNGKKFKTPQSVISAINNQDISEDPNQKIKFLNPESSEKMPDLMDMVLYLTLASTFHTFPYGNMDYDPDKHLENSAWAGAAINPQVTFLSAMGFDVEKIGNNFRGISTHQFEEIKAAGENPSKNVLLLVNSSMLDTLTGALKEYGAPRPIEHKSFGTHWITIDKIDESTDQICIWEYGKKRVVKGISRIKPVIAGGIIINGYHPAAKPKTSPVLHKVPSQGVPSH